MQPGRGLWQFASAIFGLCGTRRFTFGNVADVIPNTAVLKKLLNHGKIQRIIENGTKYYVLTAEAIEELTRKGGAGGRKKRRRKT